MSRRGPLGRHDDFAVRGLAAPGRRPLPTTVLWRWRWELGVMVCSAGVAWFAVRSAGIALTAAFAVLALALAAISPVRDFLISRVWVVVVQHRIRVGCREAGLHDRSGRLPVVIWTRQVDTGEEIQLWVPAGVTLADFESEREGLAVACWARDVRVRRHPRYAQLLRVRIIRRAGLMVPDRDDGPGPEPAPDLPRAREEQELFRPERRVRPEVSSGSERSEPSEQSERGW